MFNAVRNAVALLLIFFFVIAFGMMYFIASPIQDQVYIAINNFYPNPVSDTVYLGGVSLKVMMIQLFYVIVSLVTFLTLTSSFVDAQNWQQWIASALGGLFVTPLVIYIAASIWNGIAVAGFTFADISLVFINSWTLILTLNFFFGLAAFAWTRRGAFG